MSKKYGRRPRSSDDHDQSSDDHGRHSYCLDVSVRASRCPNHPIASDDMHSRDRDFGGEVVCNPCASSRPMKDHANEKACTEVNRSTIAFDIGH